MNNSKPYFKHTVVDENRRVHTVVDGNRRVTVAEESEGVISVTTEISHTSETRKRTHTVTATSYLENRRQLKQLSMAINGALGQ